MAFCAVVPKDLLWWPFWSYICYCNVSDLERSDMERLFSLLLRNGYNLAALRAVASHERTLSYEVEVKG